MKLLHYLKEEKTEEIIDILKRECSQIINVYKKAHWALLRGESLEHSPFFSKVPRIADKTKPARIPSSTPQDVHNYINVWFNDTFGWHVRNGVFTTGKLITASDYGTAYIFFPVDGYKFVYAEGISDLFIFLPIKLDWDRNQIGRGDMTIRDRFYKIEWPELIKKHKFTDKNLEKAVHEGIMATISPEVIFKCKKYYGLNYRHEDRDEILLQLGIVSTMKRSYFD